MKTLIASLMMALTLGATTTTNAGTEPVETKATFRSAVYPSAETAKLNVIVEKKAGQSAAVRLLDAKGNQVAQQHIGRNQTAVHTRFDLSELQDGTYTVEINDGTSREVKEVTLKTKVPTTVSYRTIALQ